MTLPQSDIGIKTSFIQSSSHNFVSVRARVMTYEVYLNRLGKMMSQYANNLLEFSEKAKTELRTTSTEGLNGYINITSMVESNHRVVETYLAISIKLLNGEIQKNDSVGDYWLSQGLILDTEIVDSTSKKG